MTISPESEKTSEDTQAAFLERPKTFPSLYIKKEAIKKYGDRWPFLENILKENTAKKVLPSKVDPLIQEAKEYKSAEEFVRAKTNYTNSR